MIHHGQNIVEHFVDQNKNLSVYCLHANKNQTDLGHLRYFNEIFFRPVNENWDEKKRAKFKNVNINEPLSYLVTETLSGISAEMLSYNSECLSIHAIEA